MENKFPSLSHRLPFGWMFLDVGMRNSKDMFVRVYISRLSYRMSNKTIHRSRNSVKEDKADKTQHEPTAVVHAIFITCD